MKPVYITIKKWIEKETLMCPKCKSEICQITACTNIKHPFIPIAGLECKCSHWEGKTFAFSGNWDGDLEALKHIEFKQKEDKIQVCKQCGKVDIDPKKHKCNLTREQRDDLYYK